MTQAPTAPSSAPPPTAASNPFPGPRAYDRDDQPYFFGREDEIEELTSLVLTSSATLLYAPSGAGKSSLLRAGVCPVLEQDFDVLVLPTVHFGTVARGDSPTDAPNSFVRTVGESIAGGRGLDEAPEDIARLAELARGDGSRRVLLVLDQFEEVFNDPALWQQREEFFRALTGAVDTHPWLRVVIALRSDYLASIGPYEHVLPGRLAVRYQLESLTERQAAEAIRSAFQASGVPLAEHDLTRLLDLLLDDDAVPHVRAQYVNTVQLQIVCRRLWRRLVQHGAAGRPVLGSSFTVRESMIQFIDEAIGRAVSETRADEAYIRWWLETELVSSAAHRAFVLVEDTHAAGLPIRVVETLVTVRVLQFEQRHGSRLVELTHDSMVGALQASNERWRRDIARRRHRVTVALTIVLMLLLAAFPLLQARDDEPTRFSGSPTGPPTDARFQGDGTPEVVIADVYADAPVAVTVVESRPGAAADRDVASHLWRTGDAPAAMAVDTREGAEYRVHLERQGPPSPYEYYEVSISDLPLGPDTAEGREEVPSPALGIPLDRGEATMLSFPNSNLSVGGVDVLAQDWANGWAVVEPSESSTIAVVYFPYPGADAPGVSTAAVVAWRPFGQPEDTPLGEPVSVRGGTLAFRSFTTGGPEPVLGAEASCSGSVAMYLLGAGTPSAWGEGEQLIGQGPSAVLPLNVGAGRHDIALSSADGKPVDCTLTIRSFGRPPLTEFGGHELVLDDDVGAVAYAARLPADSVLVVEPQADMTLTVVCRGAAAEPGDTSGSRVLYYAPRGGDCAVWLSGTEPPPGASLPVWLTPAGPRDGE